MHARGCTSWGTLLTLSPRARCGTMSSLSLRNKAVLATHCQSAVTAIRIALSTSLRLVNFRASLQTVSSFHILCDMLPHTSLKGGCLLQCDARLECGHICPYKVRCPSSIGSVHVLRSSFNSAIQMTPTTTQLYVNSVAPDSVFAAILA